MVQSQRGENRGTLFGPAQEGLESLVKPFGFSPGEGTGLY